MADFDTLAAARRTLEMILAADANGGVLNSSTMAQAPSAQAAAAAETPAPERHETTDDEVLGHLNGSAITAKTIRASNMPPFACLAQPDVILTELGKSVMRLFNDEKAKLVARARALGINAEQVLEAAKNYKFMGKPVDPLEALHGEIEMCEAARAKGKTSSVVGLS